MLTLSASGFVQGTDFTCTATYCEAKGFIANASFWALQKAATTLASRLGLPTITPDGKIGAKTVALIQQLAEKTALDSTYQRATKEIVSRDAAELAGAIGAILQGTLPGGTPPAITSGPKPATVWTSQLVPAAGGIAPEAGATIKDPATGAQVPASSAGALAPILIPRVPSKYVAGGLVAAGVAVLGGLALAQRRKRARAR